MNSHESHADRPPENLQSVAHILEQSVRLGSGSAPHSEPWQERAEIIPLTVGALPLLQARIVHPENRLQLPAERIWSILTNSYFRRGNLQELSANADRLRSHVALAVADRRPLSIVLPTIPFKDQNPTTTGQPVEIIDLGEHALVAQLRDLVESLRAVYEPGLAITLVSDGEVYRDVFTASSAQQVAGYTAGVQRLIAAYGLEASLSVTNFSDLVESEPGFSLQRERVEETLADSKNHRVATCMAALQRGVLVNCEIPGSSISEIEQYKAAPTERWPVAIRQTTATAAQRYASFLITTCQRSILERAFPNAMRATVHPKNAPQLPLHLVSKRNAIFPYNGVPVVKESDESLRKSLRIMRLSQLLAMPGSFQQSLDAQGNTLYYQQLGV